MFNAEKYLKLLKIDDQPSVSLEFLRKLHHQHLLQVPFENLDIHVKVPIVLDIEKIANKIIDHQRGGFCYELNGLFYELLKSLGFNCFLISAEVWSDNKWGPKYDHMAIVVKLNTRMYLCDIGFGDGCLYPKEIASDSWQVDGNSYFRITKKYDELFLEKSKDAENGVLQYRFTLNKRQFIEFIGMCEYQQTNPESSFTKKMVITKLTKTGRITLNDNKLTITELGEKTIQPVGSQQEFNILLQEHFGYSYDQLARSN